MRCMPGLAVVAALMLAGAAPAAAKTFAVIAFGPPTPGAERLRTEDNGRPDLGSALSFKEVDEAGLKALAVPADAVKMVYEILGPRATTGRDARGEAATLSPRPGTARLFYLFALLSPGAGREADFNAFYDGTHLPDVLRVPGMVWGERGRLVSATPGANAPGYLALYRFRSRDIRATIDEVNRRLKEGITRAFPTGAVGPPSFAFYAAPVAAD